MILLDTNVISEIMKQYPSEQVINWLKQQDAAKLFISSVTIAEIFYGINALPKGSRRQKIENAFNVAIKETFQHRTWAFDESSAYEYGKLMGYRKQLGKPLSILDGQIAAIARSQNATVATRNTKDFIDCGIELINPFDDESSPASLSKKVSD